MIYGYSYIDANIDRSYATVELSVWANLGKHLQVVWLCITSVKTGTRRIMRLDELSIRNTT